MLLTFKQKKNKLLRFKEVREMAAMSSEHGMGGDRKRANGMLLCSTDQTRFQSNFFFDRWNLINRRLLNQVS